MGGAQFKTLDGFRENITLQKMLFPNFHLAGKITIKFPNTENKAQN